MLGMSFTLRVLVACATRDRQDDSVIRTICMQSGQARAVRLLELDHEKT